MTEAREKVEKIEKDVKLLKTVTLSKSAQLIMPRYGSNLVKGSSLMMFNI